MRAALLTVALLSLLLAGCEGRQGAQGQAGAQGQQGPAGAAGPAGPKGDPGAATREVRVVVGEKTVSCGDSETLVSIVCSAGAPDGANCPDATQATGLCVRK